MANYADTSSSLRWRHQMEQTYKTVADIPDNRKTRCAWSTGNRSLSRSTRSETLYRDKSVRRAVPYPEDTV